MNDIHHNLDFFSDHPRSFFAIKSPDRVILRHVSWQTYQSLIQDFEAEPAIHRFLLLPDLVNYVLSFYL